MTGRRVVIAVVATALGFSGPVRAVAAKRGAARKDVLRHPYTEGAVYRVDLVPGSPFVVELPGGESAKNVWRDTQYWAAETTEGSSRVMIRAIAASDIVGRRGFIHIETTPSQFRISLRVRAVAGAREVPAALQIYLAGSSATEGTARQIRQAVDTELVLARRQAAEEARAKFEQWKWKTLSSLRDDYDWGGDFRITRVVDNRLQTYISVPDGSDKAVIQFVDREGKAELVNYEFSNGVYVLENRVLRRGEKFRLVLGKEQAWVALK